MLWPWRVWGMEVIVHMIRSTWNYSGLESLDKVMEATDSPSQVCS